MATEKMSVIQAKQKMVEALRVAKEAWQEAEMPKLNDKPDVDYRTPEVGKLALAKLAIKLFDVID